MSAAIKIFKRLKKVTYYTVHLDNKKYSEFNEFLNNFIEKTEYLLELKQLVNFVFEVGNNLGAVSRYFKNEDKAFRFLVPGYIETDDPHHYGLRLYCLPVNEQIVFLFNGCTKTTLKVRDCPNCSYHFHMANLISQKIIQAIQDGIIKINVFKGELEIDDDFDLLF